MRIRSFVPALITLVINALFSLYFVIILPETAKIPMHWNLAGQPDAFYGKYLALLSGFGLNLLLFVLIYLFPYYSPKYEKDKRRFQQLLPELGFILILIFSLIQLYGYLVAHKGEILPINMLFVILGLLFIVVGNMLPKVPRNFFIGIRTPWTLMDKENWHKTHRLGAYLYIIGGLIFFVNSVLTERYQSLQNALGIFVLVLLLYPLLHSFLIFLAKKHKNT
ncbi:MAG: SdpI family protein [Candidatus Cloacimonadaceae bacterium]